MPDWPHAPVHRLGAGGAFMVTCGTYLKLHHFRNQDRLDLLQDTLLRVAEEMDWRLQAWAVFSNHYHIVSMSPDDPSSLVTLIKRVHGATAVEVNRRDGTPGRKVWHQYFETALTYQGSYLARLKYVHENPVHHGLVRVATDYQWCSASWFERMAEKPFYKTVSSFKTDRLNVGDDSFWYGVRELVLALGPSH